MLAVIPLLWWVRSCHGARPTLKKVPFSLIYTLPPSLALCSHHRTPAGKLWDALGEANDTVERYFRELSKAASDDPVAYDHAINTCKTLPPAKVRLLSD